MVFLVSESKFSFDLLKIMSKMYNVYQCGYRNPYCSLFHYSLIRVLVEYRLSQLGDSWENFNVLRNHFSKVFMNSEDIPIENEISKNPYSGLRFINENHQDDEVVQENYQDSSFPIDKIEDQDMKQSRHEGQND